MDSATEYTFTLWQLVLSVAGLVVAIVSLGFAATRAWAALFPIFEDKRNRRILEEKFSRGPFDEATIERATKYYIRPKCMNVDPTQERELRHALVATKEDLFEKVDEFLDRDAGERHLLVLADSGMGKTSFVLNYYAHNRRRRRGKRHKLALVPLGDPNADQLIAEVPEQQQTTIFLDAFDEDVKAIEDHHARIRDLLEACRHFGRVIVTCRTQFFPSDEEIPVETGIARIGARKAGDSGVFEFWKLYLAPFSDEDVRAYLRKRFPAWRRKQRREAIKIALRIPLLSARPMLLAHIPDVVASGVRIQTTYQLYDVMIRAWIVRESKWVNKAALREFSERLAVEMYVNRKERGMERVPKDELPALADEWEIRLEDWQIRGRSLLNRDAEGNYKFAHRSIMEYLFVARLMSGDKACYGVLLTDQMKFFLVEICEYKWMRVGTLTYRLRGWEVRAYGLETGELPTIDPESYPDPAELLELLEISVFSDLPLDAPTDEGRIEVARHLTVARQLMRHASDVTWELHQFIQDPITLRNLFRNALDEPESVSKRLPKGSTKALRSNERAYLLVSFRYIIAGEALASVLSGSPKARAYVRGVLLEAVPPELHSILEYCIRHGFESWGTMHALNMLGNMWFEPVSTSTQELALHFVPMGDSSLESWQRDLELERQNR